MHLRPLLLPTCALVFGACVSVAPLPVITVQPAQPFEWARGRALMRRTHRGVDFAAAFEADRCERLEWLVRIENHSDRNVSVSPEHFYYRATDAGERGPWVRAIDPTEAIASLDRSMGARRAAHVSARRNELSHSLADAFISGLFGLEHETRYEARERRADERAEHRAAIQDMQGQRELFANETVRRTLLRPGEGIGGRVFFPRLEHTGRTELLLWADGSAARFPYAQGLDVPPAQ